MPDETAAPVEVSAYAVTDQGLVRDTNEDWFTIGDLDKSDLAAAGQVVDTAGARGPLFLVCDGMGGVAGGEVASELAAQTIWQRCPSPRPPAERALSARPPRRATRPAPRRVADEGASRLELRG